jgi:hypothetical protein
MNVSGIRTLALGVKSTFYKEVVAVFFFPADRNAMNLHPLPS